MTLNGIRSIILTPLKVTGCCGIRIIFNQTMLMPEHFSQDVCLDLGDVVHKRDGFQKYYGPLL